MGFDSLWKLTYNANIEQHFDSTLRSHSTFALRRTRRGCHKVVDPMAILRYLFAKERVSDSCHTTCIEGRTSMEKTQ